LYLLDKKSYTTHNNTISLFEIRLNSLQIRKLFGFGA